MAVQRRVASRVLETRLTGPPRWIVGVDAAFSPDGGHCIAAAVVWDAAHGIVVEERVATRRVRFPYVPGLLTFREAPAVLAALRKVRAQPDLLLCDGQGQAHPRRCGIACHLGVFADIPTVGCAKSRLVGEHDEPGPESGDWVPLRDREAIIGSVLRTKARSRPVYVSVGHRILLPEAVNVVLACLRGRRLPEPTRLADRLVARVRRRMLTSSPGPV